MPFTVDIEKAKQDFPDYTFIAPLTPSEQKAAFHVQDSSGEHFCLKIINPDCNTDRIIREIVALQNLSDPGLARLVEYTNSSRQGQQRHFIVEEYVDGADLAVRLGTPWSLNDTAVFFGLLCEGLDQLRLLELVHRDLKPTNIRVRPNNKPVIIDFGLVRHLNLPDLTKTSDGARIGTPLYFAPEQAKGNKYHIDHRTDLFAVGVLLYEALTGGHPFSGQDNLLEAICESDVWMDSDTWQALPRGWRLISKKLLEKERSDRPYNAGLVAQWLRKLVVSA